MVAFEFAEKYYAQLLTHEPGTIQFTDIDDEIYVDFRSLFIDLDISNINEELSFKSAEMKEIWRPFIMKYEKKGTNHINNNFKYMIIILELYYVIELVKIMGLIMRFL